MTTASFELELKSNIQDVWEIVTDLNKYTWRSDIKRIEIKEEGKTFIEYSLEDIPTTFTITCFLPCQRYEFDLENKNMHGHWLGKFEETSTGTKITFVEEVEVSKAIMKLFVKKFLHKQQTQYMLDLKKALNEE